MDHQPLPENYPINRPLTDQEREDQLRQNEKQAVEPHYQLSVIRVNSTYLECVDKFFGEKGFMTLVIMTFTTMLLVFFSGMILIAMDRASDLTAQELMKEFFFAGGFFLFVFIPSLIVLLWILTLESFRFTHYPMRFNRKNRRVYITRMDGSVYSTEWDNIFFTLGRPPKGVLWGSSNWEVRGHLLDEDGVTVLQTFALPYAARRDEPYLLALWEFVRHYMEEGPEHLVDQVEHLMQVAHRRETFWMGFHRVLVQAKGAPTILLVGFFAPMCFLIAIGRQFAKWTSRIPVWPPGVEAECAVDPDDPYIKE